MRTGLAGRPGAWSRGSDSNAAMFVATGVQQLFKLLPCFLTVALPFPKQLLILKQGLFGVPVAWEYSLLNGHKHSKAQRTQVLLGKETYWGGGRTVPGSIWDPTTCLGKW